MSVGGRRRGDRAASRPIAALRIVIADDNEDAVDTLALLLRSEGHEVAVARNGLEAVERAAAFAPDVVLLDIGMPLLDGYEAARRLRASPRGDAMHLVALTGWGEDKDRERTRAAGFDTHLVKPARFEDVMAVLARVAEAKSRVPPR